jgi:hypothetical protein
MTTPFVAVVGSDVTAARIDLLAAGATAVLSWPELAACGEADDAPAVLFDLANDADDAALLTTALAAALSALAAVDGTVDPAVGSGGAVIVTTRPVTDTLKLVDAAGTLTGTAERDEHRFVATPIAARLRLLRAVSKEWDRTALGPDRQRGPTPVAVLAALAGQGATVVGTAG